MLKLRPGINETLHPLHFAVMYNDVVTLQLMLSVKKLDVNTKDYRDRTPLHLAVKHSPDLVPLLLNV
jgi:ankyrin repeat protein